MMHYSYELVSQKFIRRTSDRLKMGESVVLLGQSYSGKRYTMARISNAVRDADDGGIVAILPLHADISTIGELGSLMMEATGISGQASGIFDAADKYWFERKRPLTLLVPNLEVLRHELVKQFLQGLRKRVDRKQIVALLGGDQSFREFVYGPTSEFNCATQVIVQGFDKSEFSNLIESFRRVAGFEITDDAATAIWDVTGGQAVLLRYIVGRAAEERIRSDRSAMTPLTSGEVQEYVHKLEASSAKPRGFFGQALDTVWRNPECRFILEALLESETPKASLEPGLLELAGIAVRDKGVLRFSSRMMEAFFRGYFTERRRADLFAVSGDWNEAFTRYRTLVEDHWLRPESAADRKDTERILQSLVEHMTSASTEATVYSAFRNAVRCVLGFSEVTWWTWNRGWEIKEGRDSAVSDGQEIVVAKNFPEDHAYAFAQAIPRDLLNRSCRIELSAPWDRLAVAATLELPGFENPEILVISDIALNRSISRDRLRLIRGLFDAFLSAFGRARQKEYLNRTTELGNRRADVFGSILETIDDLDVDQVSTSSRVAKAIRKLGYRRVLICLVDSSRSRIEGVWDDSDQLDVNVARMTNYALGDPKDVQPIVVASGVPFVTSDASREPCINQEVVTAVGLRGLAIVPIIDRDGNTIGTIHVEREDREMPSEQEVHGLLQFGKQLAVVLAYRERTSLINSALEQITDPLAIVDASLRWRYANSSAASGLNIPKGWRRWGHAQQVADGPQESIRGHLKRALDSPATEDYLVAKQIESLHAPGDHYHLTSAPVRDARDTVLGAVLTLREFTQVHILIQAVGRIIGTGTVEPALQAVLDAMAALGRFSARIYLYHLRNGEEQLVSRLAIGYDSAKLRTFNSGEVVLSPRKPNNHTWACIDQKKGLIFTWNPDGNDGEIIQTRSGLDAWVVINPDAPDVLGKHPGDFWINLPLLGANGQTLGMLATQIEEDLDPQQFWVLQILAALASVIIETFSTHEQQKNWEEVGYQKSLATVAHHLLNRVVALKPLYARYEDAENKPVNLAAINSDFDFLLKSMTTIVKRARDFLFPPQIKPSRFNLTKSCKQLMSIYFSEKASDCGFRSGPIEIEVVADQELILQALEEMLDNTRKAVGSVLEPHVFLDLTVVGNQVEIHIEDNGCGIPFDRQEDVFKDFYSNWPDYRSNGLGLGWIRRVFKAHNGDVRVDSSTVGRGTSFVLTLPCNCERPNL